MNADSDIQVWLETVSRTQPSIIIPYVKSRHETTLRYKLRTIQQGSGGRAVIGQGGTIAVLADVPAPLMKMSLNRGANDTCNIRLVLSEVGNEDRNYEFDCPSLK
jgi:curli production protein